MSSNLRPEVHLNETVHVRSSRMEAAGDKNESKGRGKKRPSPIEGQAIESALQLRRALQRHKGPETVPMSYLRECFGDHPLTSAHKARITAALEAVGVAPFPKLDALSAHGQVSLEVVRPLTPFVSRGERIRIVFGRARVRVVAPIIALLAIAGSVASVLGLFSSSSPARRPIQRMSGDLNVAVAAFTTDGRVTPNGLALAQTVTKSLHDGLGRLDSSIAIDVRGPDAGADGGLLSKPVSSTAQARSVARQLSADIVVYGALHVEPDSTSVAPTFFLNGTKLPSAAPVTGQYGYGPALHSALSIEVNPQARADLRSALVARTTAYASAFIGVGYYLRHSLSRAERYLHAASRYAPSASLPLFDILLGNINAQNGATRAALHKYEHAAHDPTLRTRAKLGIGEVKYAEARGHCRSSDIRMAGLDAARLSFLQADRSAAHEAGLGGLLQAKARFGLGQVDLCLSSAGVAQDWSRARNEFLEVINSYRPSLVELRDDTAEAQAGIGLCDLSTKRPPTSYAKAYREYSAAAGLTTQRARAAYFYGVAAFAAERLHEYAMAYQDYRRATELTTSRREAQIYAHAAAADEHR